MKESLCARFLKNCEEVENDEFVNPKTTKEDNKMNDKNYQYSMSDLIATMAINGATKDELERVIKYSAAVINAERARKELGIEELEKKYMSRYPIPTTVEVVCVDPATGEGVTIEGKENSDG